MRLGLDTLGLPVEKQQGQESNFGKTHMQAAMFAVIRIEVIMALTGIGRDSGLGLKAGKKKQTILTRKKLGNDR